ncbi:peroxide stress protein YaaA [Corynebacterium endometrii]|uniref:Uncharacterized protein n=1 Tax=Corynebacterium endometrii TaxID=2488819 RepID=A0A4P7QGT0_9CORY|nr:peroxide stress protein YaaA [Corynebacterium endometrii]QCB28680.1 hypothetical protein CENDO_07030 [Corynebacterium endometrii]
MLIILPPSETKAHGGDGAPLDYTTLSFTELTDIRKDIAADLQALDVDEALAALKLSEKLRPEAESNQSLEASPTMPAIYRYTGVLYDALDAPSLPREALERLAVGSALFGVVRATDPIPHYRLSGGSKLPARDGSPTPTMKKRWGTAITDALTNVCDGEGELIIDLRSGTYQTLGKVKDAVTVRVEAIQPDGSRKVVSHFNKHYKGELARVLALSGEDAHSIEDVEAIATSAGMTVEGPKAGSLELTLVVTP